LPDAGGLAAFSSQLDQGVSRDQVVLEIERSPEYCTDQVEGLYMSVLGRQADPGGLQQFVSAMEVGEPIENIETTMLGSPEYYALAGGTPSDYLNSLYGTVLSRPIDSNGLAFFSSLLARGFSRSIVAFYVIHSIEARQDQVESFYLEFLGREADPAGLAAFTAPRPGGYPNDQILAAMIGSDEYFQDAQVV